MFSSLALAERSLRDELARFPAGAWFQIVQIPNSKAQDIKLGENRAYTHTATPDGVRQAALSLAGLLGTRLRSPLDLYIRACPVCPPDGFRQHQHADDGWVGPQIATLIDVDPIKRPDGTTPPENIEGARIVADKILDIIDRWMSDREPEADEPSFRPRVDFSGRGYQVLIYHEPLASNEAPMKRLKLITALSMATGCAAHGVDIDPATIDNVRLKRLSGSVNSRTGAVAVVVDQGVGALSGEDFEGLVAHCLDLVGMDEADLEVMVAHGTAGGRGLLTAGETTASRRAHGGCPAPLPELKDAPIPSELLPVLNAIRAAGILRGRHHAARNWLATCLLKAGLDHGQVATIIWLGINDQSDHAARRDSRTAVKTTARRLAEGKPTQGVTALRREIGDEAFAVFRSALLGLEVAAELEEEEPPPPIEAPPSTSSHRIGAVSRIARALEPQEAHVTELVAQGLAAIGVATGFGRGAILKILKVVEASRRERLKQAAQAAFDEIEQAQSPIKVIQRMSAHLVDDELARWHDVMEAFALEVDLNLGDLRAIVRASTSLGVSHYAWIESQTVTMWAGSEVDSSWARKLRRVGRCGLFGFEASRGGASLGRHRYVCGDYLCRYCSGYAWDAARMLDSDEHWPEQVWLTRVEAERDDPDSVLEAFEGWLTEKAGGRLTHGQASLPEYVAVLHPESASHKAGAVVVSPRAPRDHARWVQVSRAAALSCVARAVTLRAERITSMVRTRTPGLHRDLWLDIPRWEALRQRGTGKRSSGFFFPARERWLELRSPLLEAKGQEQLKLYSYRHEPSSTVIHREESFAPLAEHEVYWQAQACDVYHDAMRTYRAAVSGGVTYADIIAVAARRAAEERHAEPFAHQLL